MTWRLLLAGIAPSGLPEAPQKILSMHRTFPSWPKILSFLGKSERRCVNQANESRTKQIVFPKTWRKGLHFYPLTFYSMKMWFIMSSSGFQTDVKVCLCEFVLTYYCRVFVFFLSIVSNVSKLVYTCTFYVFFFLNIGILRKYVSIPLWTLYVTVPDGLDLLRPFQVWSVCECVQMDVRVYDFTWC